MEDKMPKRVLVLTVDKSNTPGFMGFGLAKVVDNLYSQFPDHQITVVPTKSIDVNFLEQNIGRFDVLHTHDCYLPDLSHIQKFLELRKNFAWIHTFHVDGVSEYTYADTEQNMPLFSGPFSIHLFTLQFADHIIFHSDWFQKYFRNKYGWFKKGLYNINNASIIPLGVDTKIFNNTPTNKEAVLRKYMSDTLYKIHGDKKIILFVGRPSYQKRYNHFMQLNDRVYIKNNYLIIWVGFTQAYIKSDTQLAGNILTIGRLEHKDLNELMNVSDIFMNLSEHETFGLSTLEAMATYNPVVLGGKDVAVLADYKLHTDKLKNLSEIVDAIKTASELSQDDKITLYSKYKGVVNECNWDSCKVNHSKVYEAIVNASLNFDKILMEEERNEFMFKDNKFEEDISIIMRDYFHILEEQIKNLDIKKNWRILEIGGNEKTKNLFNKYTPYYEEMNLFNPVPMKDIFGNVKNVGNLIYQQLLRKQNYDLVCAFDVIEHSHYSGIMFYRMLEQAKKYVIITYPYNLGTFTHFSNDIERNKLNSVAKMQGFEKVYEKEFPIIPLDSSYYYLLIYKKIGA